MEDSVKHIAVDVEFGYVRLEKIEEEGIEYVTLEMTDFVRPHMKDAYFVRVSEKSIICVLTLRNGFVVHGESATIDALKFHWKIGCKYALRTAVDKASAMIAYMEQEKKQQGLTYKQDEPAASLP